MQSAYCALPNPHSYYGKQERVDGHPCEGRGPQVKPMDSCEGRNDISFLKITL